MDSNNKSQVCPWCQTEIVWDPELGPEDTCPHCLNELKGYRTLKLNLKEADGDITLEEEEEDADEDLAIGTDEDDEAALEVEDLLDDYSEDGGRDAYSERVIDCMDMQEYAPECTNCHELMLHAGVRVVTSTDFEAKVPVPLGEAFLTAPYGLDVFVCPSCFKTDEYLTKETKEELIRIFTPEAEG